MNLSVSGWSLTPGCLDEASPGAGLTVVPDEWRQLAVRATLIKIGNRNSKQEHSWNIRRLMATCGLEKQISQWPQLKADLSVKTLRRESGEPTRLNSSQTSISSYSVSRTCVWADGLEQMHRLDDIWMLTVCLALRFSITPSSSHLTPPAVRLEEWDQCAPWWTLPVLERSETSRNL